MQDIIQFLSEISTHPFVNFSITVISFILAIYFFFKSRQVKKFTYATNNYNITSGFINDPNGLQLSYRGRPIDTCTVSKIIFRNNGNVIINGSDISQIEPLIIKINEPYEILDAKIQKAYNYNQVSIIKSEDNKQVNVTFDYLDKKEGAEISVLHTGEEDGVFVSGIIKGIGNISKYQRKKEKKTLFLLMVSIIVVHFLLLMILIKLMNLVIPVIIVVLLTIGSTTFIFHDIIYPFFEELFRPKD